MALLRANQSQLTRVFPHNANRKYMIPSRAGARVITNIFKTISATLGFSTDVTGGDAVGWALEVDGVPVALVSVINGNADEIVLNYGLQSVGAIGRATYDGSGTWIDKGGAALRKVDESGPIT